MNGNRSEQLSTANKFIKIAGSSEQIHSYVLRFNLGYFRLLILSMSSLIAAMHETSGS